MASSTGNSSGTTRSNQFLRNSSSEKDLRHLMDERKRKRMQSNRESARRSRTRKQEHLDDLMAQVADLRRKNDQILNNINLTIQHISSVEAENSVLRAQTVELTHRLDSLNEILGYINSHPSTIDAGSLHVGVAEARAPGMELLGGDGFVGSHWNLGYMNQPIMDFGY